MDPDSRSRDLPLAHIACSMQFYHPRCIAPSGGFYHQCLDDGSIYDHSTRHLVSSTRSIVNYAMAYRAAGTILETPCP